MFNADHTDAVGVSGSTTQPETVTELPLTTADVIAPTGARGAVTTALAQPSSFAPPACCNAHAHAV